MKLLRLETITFSDATLSDIKVVLCYFLSQYCASFHNVAIGPDIDLSYNSEPFQRDLQGFNSTKSVLLEVP